VALLAALALAVAACGGGGPAGGETFDAGRAFRDLEMQVEMGPRPTGSRAARELSAILRTRLPDGRIETGPGGVRNVVGVLPGRLPAIVVGAHYDTFDLPGFVGANDGAAGVAVVLELARVLGADDGGAGREVRFVMFDGEEAPPGSPDFLAEGVRGSSAYLDAHREEIGEVIVVDFVGQRGLRLPREEGSDPGLWAELRRAAADAGVGRTFPDEVRPEILDDHTPFARAGIPAIDVIDFAFPQWHTLDDDLDAVSPDSLGAAGAALTRLLMGRRAS
jgi:Zn-dependent M28 family amino/carboxypeptidase